MTDNEKIVREFIAAWSELEPEQLVAYFTEDGVYHNMPIQPVSGHQDLLGFISGFIADWEKTDWEILNLVAQGDVVMVERIDRTVSGGRTVELPCLGVFEMRGGKIAAWRDYFDMSTYVKGLS